MKYNQQNSLLVEWQGEAKSRKRIGRPNSSIGVSANAKQVSTQGLTNNFSVPKKYFSKPKTVRVSSLIEDGIV